MNVEIDFVVDFKKEAVPMKAECLEVTFVDDRILSAPLFVSNGRIMSDTKIAEEKVVMMKMPWSTRKNPDRRARA
jgi:hypothetical protein